MNTPTYPSYAGNAACLSAASARALQIALGRDDIPFTVTYPRTMGLPMRPVITQASRILRSRKQTVASTLASITGSTTKPASDSV